MGEIAIIEHNGQQLIFDCSKSTQAEVEYIDDDARIPARPNAVCYRYRLTGAHDGPAIEALVVNPRPEPDDDGWVMEWDDCVFADDYASIKTDGYIEDAYWDALREDLWAMDWRR